MATENLIFTSGLVESATEPSLGDFLYCNRKYYSLSNQRIPYMRDKTADEQFFILTLFEIAMEFDRKKLQAKNDIIKVNLLVGLPLAHYGLLYRKFERYFKSEGNIRFTYRKTSYTIIIGEVISYPQDYAAGMTIYPEIKRHTNAWIIDIEGFSVAYLELKNGAPNKDVCDSKEHFYVQEKI